MERKGSTGGTFFLFHSYIPNMKKETTEPGTGLATYLRRKEGTGEIQVPFFRPNVS